MEQFPFVSIGTNRGATLEMLRIIQCCYTKGASGQIELLHLVSNGINRAAPFGFHQNKYNCFSLHVKSYESVAVLFVPF